MNWLEIFVDTTTSGIELVSGFLYQCGITGLIIDDEEEFKDFIENREKDWDYVEDELIDEKNEKGTGITFFLSDDIYGAEMFASVRAGLLSILENEKEFDLGSLELTIKNVKEEDWANNWKKYFKPIAVGEKIIIKPSWEEYNEDTDKKILKIDPGHIFGTGTHETTQLCIEEIEKYLKPNDMVLDIGCGSGILSIASLLLDAKFADAVDIDPNAVDIAYENAAMNNIDKSRYKVVAGNILDDKNLHDAYKGKKYDVIEANIVADVIIALSKIIPEYIKDNGVFIASGIIVERLNDVEQALKSGGFEILDKKTRKSWAAIASKYTG